MAGILPDVSSSRPQPTKRPWLLGQQVPRAYINDVSDPAAGIIDPGQPWNYYVDPGKFGTDRITKKMAQDALDAGTFYGTGYETAALKNPATAQDFAAAQTYARQSAITGLGFDPSNFSFNKNGDLSWQGKALLGEYSPKRPQGSWNTFTGKGGSDAMTLTASYLGGDQPVAFSPRIAAHESTHRGLNKMIDAVYGQPGAYFGLGGGAVSPWVDTSKFSNEENNALGQLKAIVDNPDSNLAENEWLTRLVEARITGDPSALVEVTATDQPHSGYKQMTPDDLTRMNTLLQYLESAAQKIEAQRRPGGPR